VPNLTRIIHAKIYPEYPLQILPRLSMSTFTQIIHAKICLDYPCRILPRLSAPNLTPIIHAEFNPDHPCQNLTRLCMPNFTEIIHAKIYPDYQCQILPRLTMPNSKYPILVRPDICYSVHRAQLSVVFLDALLCSVCSRLWVAMPWCNRMLQGKRDT